MVDGNHRKSLPSSICNKGINLLLSEALTTGKKKEESVKERMSVFVRGET